VVTLKLISFFALHNHYSITAAIHNFRSLYMIISPPACMTWYSSCWVIMHRDRFWHIMW